MPQPYRKFANRTLSEEVRLPIMDIFLLDIFLTPPSFELVVYDFRIFYFWLAVILKIEAV